MRIHLTIIIFFHNGNLFSNNNPLILCNKVLINLKDMLQLQFCKICLVKDRSFLSLSQNKSHKVDQFLDHILIHSYGVRFDKRVFKKRKERYISVPLETNFLVLRIMESLIKKRNESLCQVVPIMSLYFQYKIYIRRYTQKYKY